MSQPIVASYCNTFLKREMRHIYRQVTGLREFQTFVMTKSRENADVFPISGRRSPPAPADQFSFALSEESTSSGWSRFFIAESTINSKRLEPSPCGTAARLFRSHGCSSAAVYAKLARNPRWSLSMAWTSCCVTKSLATTTGCVNLLATLPLVLARSESLAARLVELGCDRIKNPHQSHGSADGRISLLRAFSSCRRCLAHDPSLALHRKEGTGHHSEGFRRISEEISQCGTGSGR